MTKKKNSGIRYVKSNDIIRVYICIRLLKNCCARLCGVKIRIDSGHNCFSTPCYRDCPNRMREVSAPFSTKAGAEYSAGYILLVFLGLTSQPASKPPIIATHSISR